MKSKTFYSLWILFFLLWFFAVLTAAIVSADEVKFQPTTYSPPATLTIQTGVGLYGTWDFTGATVLGLPVTGGGGTPGGATTQVQFNDAGAFGGDAGLIYNKATDTLTAGLFVGGGTIPAGGLTGQVLSKNSAANYDTGWITPSGGTGTGSPGGANTQVQFNDSGAFNGDAGLTYNKTTKALNAAGDVLVNGNGSTTTTPRVMGIGTWTGGNAAAFQFGDYVNALQASYGNRMAIIGYWGLEIYGGWQSGTHIPFNSGGASDPSVGIIGNTAANPILVVKAAASQTGNPQEWRDNSGNVLVRIGAGADLGLVSGSKIVWANSTNNANAVANAGIGINAAGGLEINNGTVGTYADIHAKNVTASGTVIGNGSVPAGGGSAQVLTKNSNADYDYSWKARNATKVIWITTVGSGTYTPTSGARAIYVEAVAGGGGSAGSLGTATSAAVAGGGGGGQWVTKYYSTVAASYSYSIGDGGTAGAATPTAGGSGGNTTFDVVTASGGLGSVIPTAGTTNVISGVGGAPGNGTCGCDVKLAGGNGDHGIRINGAAGGYGGRGGTSFWATSIGANNLNAPGGPGNVYGGGASGGNSNTATGQAGAAGGQGAIKITEFF
jgi:hypothetical protein